MCVQLIGGWLIQLLGDPLNSARASDTAQNFAELKESELAPKHVEGPVVIFPNPLYNKPQNLCLIGDRKHNHLRATFNYPYPLLRFNVGLATFKTSFPKEVTNGN